MDPLDQLLANIQAQPAPPPAASSHAASPLPQSPPGTPQSVDGLLETLALDSSTPMRPPRPSSLPTHPSSPLLPDRQALDRLLNQIAARPRSPRPHPSNTISHPPAPVNPPAPTPQQHDTAAPASLSQSQQAILMAQATQWLEQVTPNAEEWLWFEELAHHYPSRLAAAMEYLQVVGGHQAMPNQLSEH